MFCALVCAADAHCDLYVKNRQRIIMIASYWCVRLCRDAAVLLCIRRRACAAPSAEEYNSLVSRSFMGRNPSRRTDGGKDRASDVQQEI